MKSGSAQDDAARSWAIEGCLWGQLQLESLSSLRRINVLPNEEERTQTANLRSHSSLPREEGRRTQHPGNGKRVGSVHRLLCAVQRDQSAAGAGHCRGSRVAAEGGGHSSSACRGV